MDLNPKQHTSTSTTNVDSSSLPVNYSYHEHLSTFLPATALLILSINTGTAMYRALGDAWTECFLLSSYVMLLRLYWCVGAIQRVPKNQPANKLKLKVVMWVLASALNLMLYQVSKVLPLALSVVSYVMAGSVAVFGLVALFVWKDEASLQEDCYCGEVQNKVTRRKEGSEIGSQEEKLQLIV